MRKVRILALFLLWCCGMTPFSATAEEIQVLLGMAWHDAQEGHFRAAERNYRRVLKRDATNPQALYGLAVALKAQGKTLDAIELLEGLVQTHPDFQAAYYLLGVIYENQGDLDRAKQAYRTYVAIAPAKVPPDPEIRLKLRSYGIF